MTKALRLNPIESEIPNGERRKASAGITNLHTAEGRQKLTIQVLELLNQAGEKTDTIRDILLLIKESTGFEAVGIRLREGEDFPYYETSGFPAHFVEAERYLCARDPAGELIRDSEGNPCLDCMCGNIICKRTDPSLPFFTEGGSFWTNGTTELLASTTEKDRQARTRNRCNSQGYESVALVPLRSDDETVGLLQLNDSRNGMSTLEGIKFFEGIGASIGIALKHKKAEDQLLQQTYHLRERVKELNCMYGISKVLEKPGISLEEIIQGIVDLTPPSYQYPETTCGRIILEGRTFKTNNFKKTLWKQASNIMVNKDRLGSLEIYYLEEKPEAYEGPFLKEERDLINSVAGRLGRIFETKQNEKALGKSEERYRMIAENSADGICLVQDGKFQFVNPALASIVGYTTDRLVEKDPVSLFHDDHKELFRKLVQSFDKGTYAESFQAICIHKDGQEIWVGGHFNIIDWEGRPAVLITVRDINERKLRESAIEEESACIKRENINLKSSLKDRYRFGNIIGKSLPMQEVYELIAQASGSDASVIIYGESGTGKELVAHAIHDMSNRRDKKIVTVNCGAIPETLLESEFFGYKKGAFTGALVNKHGYLDLADGGTLFLDEVGELNLNTQAKLLRAIDGGGYAPVGGNQIKTSDFRIIAATNKNLLEQLKRGAMREDFFYRINVIPITLPSLRDRKEDIHLLVDHFLKRHSKNKKPRTLPGNILEAIYHHDWPGNVRELKNVLKRYLTINRLDFINNHPTRTFNGSNISSEGVLQENPGSCKTLEAVERKYIAEALEQNGRNRAKTAKTLGISERTLYRKLKQFHVIMS